MQRRMRLTKFVFSAVLILPCALVAQENAIIIECSADEECSRQQASSIDVMVDGGEKVALTSAMQDRSQSNHSLLKPIQTSTTLPGDRGDSANGHTKSGDITVLTSQFERGLRDNYTLAVTNGSSHDYKSLLVIVEIPEGCQVHQILPKPISVSDNKIIFSISQLASHKQELISIAATSPGDQLVEFPARVLADITQSDTPGLNSGESLSAALTSAGSSRVPTAQTGVPSYLASTSQEISNPDSALPMSPYTPRVSFQPQVPQPQAPQTQSPQPQSSLPLEQTVANERVYDCLLYTSPSPRDQRGSRMPSSA